MLAVVVVRDGELPLGADETVAECNGRALLIGASAAAAADQLHGVATDVRTIDTPGFRPGAWAAALADSILADEPIIVLPASPDGRDLAPRLAAALGRPALLNAAAVSTTSVTLIRRAGLDIHRLEAPAAFVATLQPGIRGALRDARPAAPTITECTLRIPDSESNDATVVAVLPPDAATMDLAESPRILGGGAGLDSAERFTQLAHVGEALDASIGATRVITDRGWIEHDRQIGTTGVVVDPSLYIAFGISGAVQHVSGLGNPDHVISVNTDAHCPMMQIADLAIVADANAVLDHLARRLTPHLTGSEAER